MNGEKLIACEMHSMINDRYFGEWLTLHVPFTDHDELLFDWVADLVPEQYKYFANALVQRRDFWENDDAIERTLQLEALQNDRIATFLAMVEAQRYLVDLYLVGELDASDDAGAKEALVRAGLAKEEDMKFNHRQTILHNTTMKYVARSREARTTEDATELEQIKLEAWSQRRVIAGLGPPGTGKTTVVETCIRKTIDDGGSVLYALPTAQQASRVRTRVPEAVDVDTCSGAFYFYRSSSEIVDRLDCLTQHDLIVVDEISQLSRHNFNRILKLWDAAGRLPALVFTGDFHQLPGFNPSTAKESPRWKHVDVIELHEVWRCQDEELNEKLRLLRLNKPTEAQLKDICRGHKAWSGHHDPTDWEISELLRKHPSTTVVTCTRRGAAVVNEKTQTILFKHRKQPLLETIPADWEINEENYDEDGKVKENILLKPSWIDLYKGLKVFLTMNINKKADFVNGMEATVQRYSRKARCVHVKTKTGRSLAVYPVTETGWRATAESLRTRCAWATPAISTSCKVQSWIM